MMRAVKTRQRIARIRKVQHVQAAAIAAQAENKAVMLETSAERLAQLRLSLVPDFGSTSGATLSQSAELAMRLDTARNGLHDAIATARAIANHEDAQRLEARRQQEAAEKLGDRAAAALAQFLERSNQVVRQRRSRLTLGDE